MRKYLVPSVVVLIVMAVLASWVAPVSVQTTGKRWEYCSIGRPRINNESISRGWVVPVYQFTAGGVRLREIPAPPTDASTANLMSAEDASVRCATAVLGSEGWELVMMGPSNVSSPDVLTSFYFKRQLP